MAGPRKSPIKPYLIFLCSNIICLFKEPLNYIFTIYFHEINCVADRIRIRSLRRKTTGVLSVCSFLFFKFALFSIHTERPKIYRKSVLHLLKYRFDVYLNSCSTNLWYILGHSAKFTANLYCICLSIDLRYT